MEDCLDSEPEELTMSPNESKEVERLTEALSAPFPQEHVRFKPGVVSGGRALALVYVDARAIQDRLDEVLGVAGWQDEYECLPDGAVVCKLRLRLGAEWITKSDVGGPSEQPDEGDRRKAAFSDALKRAAVKFGIGRYLYRLKSQWVDYDPQKRQFVRPPTLPAAEPKPAPRPAPPAAKPAARPASAMPADGQELLKRLTTKDAQLAARGVCRPGELIRHVTEAGQKAGHNADLSGWTGPAIALAVEAVKAFEARKRPAEAARKDVA
jgi:hypothetical protein